MGANEEKEKKGISKQIFVGIRKDEQKVDYLSDFIAQAKKTKMINECSF